jgi:outer membrane protein assembly factor BamB
MLCRFLCLTLVLLPTLAAAEEWPGWRGPRGDGSSTETAVPVRWSQTDNVAWKTPIPGIGHSSPVVHGDRVFVTTCLLKEKQRVLLCLDRRDGRVLWQRVVVTSPLEQKHRLNSYASSTPATDGKHVWTAFLRLRPQTADDPPASKPREPQRVPKGVVPEMLVTCWTVEGEKVWEKVPGRFYSPHGFCSPPIRYKDTIILNGDQDAEAWLVALEKATGAERWRIDRPGRMRSYCAPLLIDAAGKKQMVLSGDLSVASFDPDTGKQHWVVDGPTEQFVASPVFTDGVVFLTAGYPDFHNLGIRPDGSGDVTGTHVLWHEKKLPSRKASYVPSPIAHNGHFFVVSDLGWARCFEARTGKALWMEKLGEHHSASPVSANGLLYFPSDEGVTFVLRAGPRFELVARNDLGEACYASPAVSGGQIFLRTVRHLYCLGKTGKTDRSQGQAEGGGPGGLK